RSFCRLDGSGALFRRAVLTRQRRRRFRRCLIAFHQIRWHALGNARHTAGKYVLTLARQLFLLVQMEDVELVHVEAVFAAGKREAECKQHADKDDPIDAAGHKSQPFPLAAISAERRSMRARVPAGVSASAVIMSMKCSAAAAS